MKAVLMAPLPPPVTFYIFYKTTLEEVKWD